MKTDLMRKAAARGGNRLAAAIRALLLLLVVLASPAHAESEACANAQTTAEMRACAEGRYQAARSRLAAVLGGLNARLPAPRRTQLAAAQAAWRNYANAEAAFQAGAATGGSLAPLIRTETLAELTESRAQALERSLSGLGSVDSP